jgi:predicted aminopeptidase
VLADFYTALVGRLEALYGSKPDSARLEQGRREAGAWARAQLVGPVGQQLRTLKVGPTADRPINNARLIGARIYRTRLDLFEQWFQQHAGDVGLSVSALKNLMTGAEGDSAYARLERAVTDSTR